MYGKDINDHPFVFQRRTPRKGDGTRRLCELMLMYWCRGCGKCGFCCIRLAFTDHSSSINVNNNIGIIGFGSCWLLMGQQRTRIRISSGQLVVLGFGCFAYIHASMHAHILTHTLTNCIFQYRNRNRNTVIWNVREREPGGVLLGDCPTHAAVVSCIFFYFCPICSRFLGNLWQSPAFRKMWACFCIHLDHTHTYIHKHIQW